MAIQLIFCVETNKRADTDSIYINEMIHYLYNIDNKVKISKVYMGSKTKYKSKEIIKEISNKKEMYKLGDSIVIYCIDTDQYETNQEHKSDYEKIQKYCDMNNYELIWFCHDIEEVFLGHKVPDSEKVKQAANFKKGDIVNKININMLQESVKRINASNMLNVLDKYLQRK